MKFDGEGSRWWWCEPCSKRAYPSRKGARRATRGWSRGQDRARTYPCPIEEGTWHNGHLPDDVRHGLTSREAVNRSMRERDEKL